ncbi:hypothetical protein ACFFRR_009673 [Megaselia abdita]
MNYIRDEIQWHDRIPGHINLFNITKRSSYGNRNVLKLDVLDDTLTILKALDNGVTVVGIDMNQGSFSDFKRLFRDLSKALKFKNEYLEIVKFIILSPRFPITGYLRDNVNQFILQLNDSVILTSDRLYSTQSTNTIIYTNSKKCIQNSKKGDIVQVANIRIKVLRAADSGVYLYCVVVFPGVLSSRSIVLFPSECDRFSISEEELEDINFANDFDISVIVTPSPGCKDYISSVKKNIAENKRMFSKINIEHLRNENQLKWTINNYDGFFLNLVLNKAGKRFSFKDDMIKIFLNNCYFSKKPVVLSEFRKESLINEHHENYFTCLPEKFILQKDDVINVKQVALNSFESISLSKIHQFALDQIHNFTNKSLTTSDTFALGIVSMAYNTNSDVIILYSYSGRMPMKISHFRPLCPIVTFIHCISARRYSTMFYNINTIPESYSEKECEHWNNIDEKTDVCGLSPKRLLKALTFCLKRKFIEQGSEILIALRSKVGKAYQNKFIHFKYKKSHLVESELKEILQ